MINKMVFLAAILAFTLSGAKVRAEDEVPHYPVATISVSDFDTCMSDNASVAIPTILEAGGEILVAWREASALETEMRSNWTVVARFPSEATARR